MIGAPDERVREALRLAQEAIEALSEHVDHNEDCPMDDTCVCPVPCLVNDAHREVREARIALGDQGGTR